MIRRVFAQRHFLDHSPARICAQMRLVMAGAGSNLFDAIERYPMVLLDGKRILGGLENDARTHVC